MITFLNNQPKDFIKNKAFQTALLMEGSNLSKMAKIYWDCGEYAQRV